MGQTNQSVTLVQCLTVFASWLKLHSPALVDNGFNLGVSERARTLRRPSSTCSSVMQGRIHQSMLSHLLPGLLFRKVDELLCSGPFYPIHPP